jgi:hypothetical protein
MLMCQGHGNGRDDTRYGGIIEHPSATTDGTLSIDSPYRWFYPLTFLTNNAPTSCLLVFAVVSRSGLRMLGG